MANKSVITTGAASGIALAAAETLATDGWAVVPVDRDADALHAAVDGLRGKGLNILEPVVTEIGDESSSAHAVARATSHGYQLAGLINAAANNSLGVVDEISAEDLDASYRINVRGAFLMIQAAIPALRANGGGAIVNVGSVDSYVGEPGTLATAR
jgi:NAD(P)-dependent dehydrogenase (short-subunit alcohol dehydrogenase family)